MNVKLLGIIKVKHFAPVGQATECNLVGPVEKSNQRVNKKAQLSKCISKKTTISNASFQIDKRQKAASSPSARVASRCSWCGENSSQTNIPAEEGHHETRIETVKLLAAVWQCDSWAHRWTEARWFLHVPPLTLDLPCGSSMRPSGRSIHAVITESDDVMLSHCLLVWRSKLRKFLSIRWAASLCRVCELAVCCNAAAATISQSTINCRQNTAARWKTLLSILLITEESSRHVLDIDRDSDADDFLLLVEQPGVYMTPGNNEEHCLTSSRRAAKIKATGGFVPH